MKTTFDKLNVGDKFRFPKSPVVLIKTGDYGMKTEDGAKLPIMGDDGNVSREEVLKED